MNVSKMIVMYNIGITNRGPICAEGHVGEAKLAESFTKMKQGFHSA
jgi:hypothetical protein